MAVRFGIQIEPQFGFSYDDISAIAHDTETLRLGPLVAQHVLPAF